MPTQNYEMLIYVLLAMGAAALAVVILRELLTWMLRINDIIANQQRIIELLEEVTRQDKA